MWTGWVEELLKYYRRLTTTGILYLNTSFTIGLSIRGWESGIIYKTIMGLDDWLAVAT